MGMAPQHIGVVRNFGRAPESQTMSVRVAHSPRARTEAQEECVEGACCELRLYGVLRSSSREHPKMGH